MMSLTELLSRATYSISNALLLPDLVFMLVLFVVVVMRLGGLLGEWWDRHRHVPAFRSFMARIQRDADLYVRLGDVPARFGYPAAVMANLAAAPVDKLIDNTQLEMEAALSRVIVGIRIGPMLGLAGTLIPLGPALMGMSQGKVDVLSEKLVVAFSVTVVGLFIAGACYFVYSVRQRWYAQDLNDLEFLLKRLNRGAPS